VIPVDPLLTCEECRRELWWNEPAELWECSDCKAVVDPFAEERDFDHQGASLLSRHVSWLS
jgi:ribosomal protein L37AE/L43A